jgi:DNA polymerase-1
MAINHPIQGSSADIVKLAMVAVIGQLSSVNCRPLLQIHDELLFEMADGIIEETYPKIKDIMENVYKLTVPLQVDVSTGPSWGELKR